MPSGTPPASAGSVLPARLVSAAPRTARRPEVAGCLSCDRSAPEAASPKRTHTVCITLVEPWHRRSRATVRLHACVSTRSARACSARNRSGQRENGNKFDVSRTHLNRRLPKSTHLALTVSHGASRVSSARVQVCVSQDTHATVGHTHALIRPSRDGSRSLSLTLCGAILGTGKKVGRSSVAWPWRVGAGTSPHPGRTPVPAVRAGDVSTVRTSHRAPHMRHGGICRSF